MKRDDVQAALDRLMASGAAELDAKTFEALMRTLTGHPTALPPGFNDPVPLQGLTRAERSANNRLAHKIVSEQRAEDARQAREERRADHARSRLGTRPDPSPAGHSQREEG